jgi:hypothetical protein
VKRLHTIPHLPPYGKYSKLLRGNFVRNPIPIAENENPLGLNY